MKKDLEDKNIRGFSQDLVLIDDPMKFPIQNMADGNYSPSVNIAFDSMKNFVKNKENFHRNGNRKEKEKVYEGL